MLASNRHHTTKNSGTNQYFTKNQNEMESNMENENYHHYVLVRLERRE
jgi:hypothetical protein